MIAGLACVGGLARLGWLVSGVWLGLAGLAAGLPAARGRLGRGVACF